MRILSSAVALIGLIVIPLAGAEAGSVPPASFASAEGVTAGARDCAPREADDASWDGYGRVRGGKGYVATPVGQVHYRLQGPAAGQVLVLLHQTPWSMVQFADIQACLAGHGIRSLALDTPGYGQSDAPASPLTIAEYAANILPVLDRLDIGKVSIAGHHTGAAIAASFAAQFPDRIHSVILHGAPNYNDAERAQRKALPHPELALKPDGSHLSSYFAKLYGNYGQSPRNLATVNWSTINIYWAGPADTAHSAVYEHRMGDDLAAIRAPLLILSDRKDALNEIDKRTGAMKPNFQYIEFSDGSPHSMMIQADRWAAITAGFVRKAEGSP